MQRISPSPGSFNSAETSLRIAIAALALLAGGPAGRNALAGAPVRVERMTTVLQWGSYTIPDRHFALVGSADIYFQSDGTQTASSRSGDVAHWSQLVRVEVSGTTIRYLLSPPEVGLVYQQLDYRRDGFWSSGKLGAEGPLVLEAEAGTKTAVLRGLARVVENEWPWEDDSRFRPYIAVTGSVVPFEVTYTLAAGTWQANTFDGPFTYTGAGLVDFANAVSRPVPEAVSIYGAPRVPAPSTLPYRAEVRYASGAIRDETWASTWTVSGTAPATVSAGILAVDALASSEETAVLGVSFTQDGAAVAATKSVRCLREDPAESPGRWPMYQANARHTGYLPVSLEPRMFRVRWRRDLGNVYARNPVAAGEGGVFVTAPGYTSSPSQVWALDARDGSTRWTRSFDGVDSIAPPGFAHGLVYAQTVNYGSSYLRAFDAEDGSPVFKFLHELQFDRYYAPTFHERDVYVPGGAYGGLFRLDAYSGAQHWFTTLPDQDKWTPAVDGDSVYAYFGGRTPGLYVKDRLLGVPANYFVPDANFNPLYYDLDLAPVVGRDGVVFVIQGGRLLCLDPGAGTIRWERSSSYSGQPSLAHGLVYAVDGRRLVAIDESTGQAAWSWEPEEGQLTGPMIVTDTHVLASTESAVHAVSLSSRRSEWSHPVAGRLALADETLYVVPGTGPMTAISTSSRSRFHPVSPCRLMDTRASSGAPVGGPALEGLFPRPIQVSGHCGIPATARAVAINVTAVEPSAAGTVTLAPKDAPAATVSVVSCRADWTRAASVVMPIGDDGKVVAILRPYVDTFTDLVIDVSGYFQ